MTKKKRLIKSTISGLSLALVLMLTTTPAFATGNLGYSEDENGSMIFKSNCWTGYIANDTGGNRNIDKNNANSNQNSSGKTSNSSSKDGNAKNNDIVSGGMKDAINSMNAINNIMETIMKNAEAAAENAGIGNNTCYRAGMTDIGKEIMNQVYTHSQKLRNLAKKDPEINKYIKNNSLASPNKYYFENPSVNMLENFTKALQETGTYNKDTDVKEKFKNVVDKIMEQVVDEFEVSEITYNKNTKVGWYTLEGKFKTFEEVIEQDRANNAIYPSWWWDWWSVPTTINYTTPKENKVSYKITRSNIKPYYRIVADSSDWDNIYDDLNDSNNTNTDDLHNKTENGTTISPGKYDDESATNIVNNNDVNDASKQVQSEYRARSAAFSGLYGLNRTGIRSDLLSLSEIDSSGSFWTGKNKTISKTDGFRDATDSYNRYSAVYKYVKNMNLDNIHVGYIKEYQLKDVNMIYVNGSEYTNVLKWEVRDNSTNKVVYESTSNNLEKELKLNKSNFKKGKYTVTAKQLVKEEKGMLFSFNELEFLYDIPTATILYYKENKIDDGKGKAVFLPFDSNGENWKSTGESYTFTISDLGELIMDAPAVERIK